MRGTTAIEFAMISVPFLGLIGAIFETGTVYFRTAQLQMATESASRAVLTHSLPAGYTYDKLVRERLCTWKNADGTTGSVQPGTLGQMFDCDQLQVDVQALSSWSGSTNNSLPTHLRTDAITLPAPGQIAIVRVVYPMTVLMGLVGGSPMTGGGGYKQIRNGQTQSGSTWTYKLMGIAAFRVEPG